MSKKHYLFFFFTLFSTLFTCILDTNTAYANTMYIRGLSIQAEDTRVHITSGVLFSQLQDLESILKEGIEVRFICEIQLAKNRLLWLNETIAEQTHTIQLSFNPISKTFAAMQNTNILSVQDNLEKVLQKTIENFTFSLSLGTPLIPAEIYQIIMSVTLQKSDMPKWVQASLFFWSWDIVQPIQLRQNFTF